MFSKSSKCFNKSIEFSRVTDKRQRPTATPPPNVQLTFLVGKIDM